MWFCFFTASAQCVSNGSLIAKTALCSDIFHSICFPPSTSPSTPFSQHYSSLRTKFTTSTSKFVFFTPSCTRGYSNGKSMNFYSEDISVDSGLDNGEIPMASILTILLKTMSHIKTHLCILRCKIYGMGS